MQVPNLQSNNELKRPIKPFLSRCEEKVYYIYFTHPESGKRTKKSTGTTIKIKAEHEFKQFMKSQGSEVIQRCLPKKIKLSDLLGMILSAFNSRKAFNTLSLYQIAFKHLISVMGNKEINSLTRFDSDYFINALIKRKLQSTSINIYLRHIKSAFNIAISYGLIEENPFKDLQNLTIPDKIRLNLSDAECQRLFEVVQDDFILRIIKFALLTAMRLSEIIHLQWKDIDYEGQKLTISNKENFKTKSRKNRTLAITESISKILSLENDGISSNVYRLRDQNSYVFGNRNGFRFSPDYISHRFKRYSRRAGLNEKICFHTLRHSALSKMALSGIPINVLKEIAGHSSITTTQKYLHTDIKVLNEFMRKVDFGF